MHFKVACTIAHAVSQRDKFTNSYHSVSIICSTDIVLCCENIEKSTSETVMTVRRTDVGVFNVKLVGRAVDKSTATSG